MKDDAKTSTTSPTRVLNDLILRSIVDHAIVTLDADGIVTSWNEGAERILGWTEAEIVGRSADVFFTPEDVAEDRPEEEMRIALADGRADDERWHVRRDGRRFWGSGLMMPLLRGTNAAGDAVQDGTDVGGFVKVFRDRTFEHEASRRIVELETRATLAMRRSGTVGVFEFDLREDILLADPVCAALHGLDADMTAKGSPLAAGLRTLHADDRPGVEAALQASREEGVDFDEIYRVETGGRRPRWVHAQGAVQRDDIGRLARLSGIVVDVSEAREQARMQDARIAFTDRIRDLTDPVAVAALASETIARTVYATRVGHGSVGADGDTIEVHADWCAPGGTSLVGRHRFSDFGSWVSVLRDGEAVVMEDVRTDPRVGDPDALAGIGIRALVNKPLMDRGRLRAVLFVNDDGPRAWTDTEVAFMRAVFDRCYAAIDRLRSEAERDVMASELAHRMKNMLTVAQVVVTQSLRGVPGVERARSAIAARLHALGEAQEVLTRHDGRDAGIEAVIETALKPFDSARRRISLEGPAVDLGPRPVLGLSLGLHELATNAVKHGALSGDEGRVEIRWTAADGAFSLEWAEHDGPPVAPPASRGFGSTILDRVVGDYFGGTAKVEYAPDGVRFRLQGTL